MNLAQLHHFHSTAGQHSMPCRYRRQAAHGASIYGQGLRDQQTGSMGHHAAHKATAGLHKDMSPPLGQGVSQEEGVVYLVLVLNLQQWAEQVSARARGQC